MSAPKIEAFPVAPGAFANIDKARRIVRGRKANSRLYVPVAAWCLRHEVSKINKRHLRSGKLKDDPVILMRVAGVSVLIDGWHRAARAHRRRKKWLPAHLLTASESDRIGIPMHYLKPVKHRRK